MRIKTDFNGELEIPKVIADEIVKEYGVDYGCIISGGNRFDIDGWDLDFGEIIGERLSDCGGKIVDKELAIFLRDWVVNTSTGEGGYPISEETTIGVNKEYTILVFASAGEEKYRDINIIGYMGENK